MSTQYFKGVAVLRLLLEKLLSLLTFFAAAKKVSPAPDRGRANRPLRKQVPQKAKRTKTERRSISAKHNRSQRRQRKRSRKSPPMTGKVIGMNDACITHIGPAIN